jgi:prepilin-type processing-associated H-X9-DG protein
VSDQSRHAEEATVGIADSLRRTGYRGFSSAEIGAAALTMVVLIGVGVPVYRRYEERSQRARASQTCLSNMKRLGLATLAYMQDNDDSYPVCNRTYLKTNQNDASIVQASWMRHILPYVANGSSSGTQAKDGKESRPDEAYFCPATPRPEDRQTIYGVGGNEAESVRLSRRSVGANGLLFYLSNDPTGRQTRTVTQQDVGKPERLPVIADAASFLWTDPRYLIFSSYVSATEPGSTTAWSKELGVDALRTMTGTYARHAGGVNLIYGDGHTAWQAVPEIGPDPARKNEAVQLNYRLAFVPVDRVDTRTGAVTLPQDDRLR